MSKSILQITKNDLVIEYYNPGGRGGQKRNKTANAARVKHPPSGAIGQAKESRKKNENLKLAFNRMANSRDFQLWLKMKTSALLKGYADIEEYVEGMMKEEDLKIEYFDPKEKK